MDLDNFNCTVCIMDLDNFNCTVCIRDLDRSTLTYVEFKRDLESYFVQGVKYI